MLCAQAEFKPKKRCTTTNGGAEGEPSARLDAGRAWLRLGRAGATKRTSRCRLDLRAQCPKSGGVRTTMAAARDPWMRDWCRTPEDELQEEVGLCALHVRVFVYLISCSVVVGYAVLCIGDAYCMLFCRVHYLSAIGSSRRLDSLRRSRSPMYRWRKDVWS